MWGLDQSRLLGPLRYQRVATTGENVVEEESMNPSFTRLPPIHPTEDVKSTRYTLIHFSASSICLFASLSFFLFRYYHGISDDKCMRRFSAPSPALEAVRFEWVTFNDAFQADEYGGYPSAASEKEWAKLWDFGAFSVPLESLSGLNKSSMTGDFRLVDNGPDAGVGGLLEGAHQIHCLNLVRQFIYRDHWDYSDLPSFGGGEKTRRHHVDHCIETLRTVFTCLGDVTPYILVESGHGGKVESRGLPHKCRKYLKLVDWVNTNSVFDTVEE